MHGSKSITSTRRKGLFGMSENSIDGKETQETSPANSESTETKFEPITSQEHLNRILSERIGRERKKYADYEQLREKASRLDELEEAQKTELEKAQERATKAEAKAVEAELRVTRTEIANKHNVPAELLQGTTAEDLEKSAEALIKFREEANETRSKNLRGGFNPLLGLPPKENSSVNARKVARALFNRE